MYWPLGAPRVYAASRRRRKPPVESNEEKSDVDSEGTEARNILGLKVARHGHLFITITRTALTVWQTSPVLVLASVTRSIQSLKSYGDNVGVLLRPDASIAVIQTSSSFLITYGISIDPNARVYQLLREEGHARKQSSSDRLAADEERRGYPEVNIRFRMVIKVDAGIGKVLALDDELVVATEKPPAVQCIRWSPDNSGSQTSTELLSRMAWIQKKSAVVDMVYDRAMSLAVWITKEGRAYAVQRTASQPKDSDGPRRLFRGYGFHTPEREEDVATKAAINARFSLLAVGCTNAEIHVYTARDYVGSIPLSHQLEPPASMISTGPLTTLVYSPDGYCLFAGYEKGWAIWSVYGKLQGSSFNSDPKISEINGEGWLQGLYEAVWLHAGSNILFTRSNDDRLWLMEVAKSAVTGCLCAANVSRTVLLTNSGLMVYRGYDLPSLTAIPADASLWHHVSIPPTYLANQKPIRSAVISPDGRYVAIAGRRGLAHYSVTSGRWKTFDDMQAENSFVVRGGMCWYQHILIAAVESHDYHELRLYSREHGLDDSSLLYVEQLPSPAVTIALTGQDSLLVYTYQNILYHFVINASTTAVTLVQVGQIALHGIVRAPARVRAVSWILPDHQLREGDPSQDVAHASVIFLVDAKLVLLQSSTENGRGLKYDMRVIANNVEYFDLMRDQFSLAGTPDRSLPPSPNPEEALDISFADRGLKDSLWYFDGKDIQCWMNVEDLIESASTTNDRDLPLPVTVPTDFYPTSIALAKGIVLGIDADLVQRRDVQFAYYRFSIRTQLFLPPIFHRQLLHYDDSAASALAHRYQSLPYFSHTLELLLHTVLDDEVDSPPSDPKDALLPRVLSFLSPFPTYLDILVQCTRKTEVRSWRTLFSHLPPPETLFEQSLQKNMLKTAGGYLLVMHTFDDEEGETSSEQCVRLLQRAKEAGDWDLCKELARFLMALDETGEVLRGAVGRMGLALNGGEGDDGVRLKTPTPGQKGRVNGGLGIGGLSLDTSEEESEVETEERKGGDHADYFSR
ncbi:WD40 repeat protein [Lecanora helva]